MTGVGILLTYAITTALFGGLVLGRGRWLAGCPRLGVLCWLAVFASVFLATATAGLLMVSADVVHMFQSGSSVHFAEFPTQAACLLVLGAAVAAIVTALGAIITSVRRTRRHCNEHLTTLRAVAQVDRSLGVHVLASSQLGAYSIAAQSPAIVLTEGAIAALSEQEITGVIAHETAHLRGHHATIVACADGLRRAFRGVPLFRVGHKHLVELLEMAADDHAVSTVGRRPVAAALLQMAESRSPTFAMSAASGNVGVRVRRLVRPEPRLNIFRTLVGIACVAAFVVLPTVGMVSASVMTGQNVACVSDKLHEN